MTDFHSTLPAVESRTRPLRGMLACVLVGLILATVTLVEHPGLYTIVLGLGLCVLGPVLYSWLRGRLDFFEPIHVFGAVYFVYFGLGSVWTTNEPNLVAYDLYIVPYVPRSALYCLLGYLTLLLGYYGPWSNRHDTPRVTDQLRGPMFLFVTTGLGLAGFLAVAVQERDMVTHVSLTTVISSLTQLSPIFLFAWALAWMYVYAANVSWTRKVVILGALIPAALVTALATFSDKSLITTMIGVPIIARWYRKRRMPWPFLVGLLLVLVFVIFPFYNTYRWSDPNMGRSERMLATYQTVQSWDSDKYLFHSMEQFKRRLAMINSVAVVVRDVDRWVPYAKGSTIFVPAVTYFIPRVLWPEKPVQTFGRDFGRIFRVTNPFTRDTYIAVTVPGELYWNFGVAGVLLGMGIFGAGLRVIYRRYGEGMGRDPVSQAIYILLLIQVAHLGSSLAGDFVVMIRTLVVLEAMRWIGRRLGMIERVVV